MALDMDTGGEKEVDWSLMSQVNLRNKAFKWFWAAGALFVIGCLIIAGGLFFGQKESAEPVEVFSATEEDQYVYAKVQYLSTSFGYYSTMRNMRLYLALDNELMPSVLSMHQDDVELLEPYRDAYYYWLYDWENRDKPEECMVYGYAKPYDKELLGYVKDVLELFAGTELTEETVKELMGSWYVQVGGSQGTFQFFQLAAVFIVGSGFAFLAGAIDFSAWRRFLREIKEPERFQGPIIREDHSIAHGIVGALAGALLSAMIWLVVGASEIPVFWVGGAAIFFSYMGYLMGANDRHMGLGVLISAVCSVLLLIPAVYLEWCWRYYSRANAAGLGYIPLSRAVRELPQYLLGSRIRDEVGTELMLGGGALLFGLVCCVFSCLSKRREQTKNGSGMR